MPSFKISLLVFSVVFCTYAVHGFNILGISHTQARSHFFIGHALFKGLAEAGHNVTVLTTIQSKKVIPNYHEIFLDGLEEKIAGLTQGKSFLEIAGKGSTLTSFIMLTGLGTLYTNFSLSHHKLQPFLKNPHDHFDVIICEIFLNDALLGLSHTLKAPIIALSTFGSSKWTNDLVGTPAPLSYVPSPFLSYTDHMSFVERIGNVLYTMADNINFNWFYWQAQTELYDKYFQNPKPDLDTLRKNVSLVLLNTHFSLSSPKPYAPNMIEVGGIQINRKFNKLPKDIQEFMDNATDGVIYFSMGSNIKGTDLPPAIFQGILKIFSQLKQRVLWKWEDPTLPGKPDNVLIKKWFPQDDILAHPNVKIFITHGGLLGSTEAIYHGIPVIGIPVYGDQELNMAKAESDGYGISVPYKTFSIEKLDNALNKLLLDDSYSQKAKAISFRYRDQPMTPLETAIYWVEYVARHKGAPHLRCAGLDLNFIQYHSLDVFGFFALVILSILISIKFVCGLLFCRRSKKVTKKVKSQ